jgi:hypothetical protein
MLLVKVDVSKSFIRDTEVKGGIEINLFLYPLYKNQGGTKNEKSENH